MNAERLLAHFERISEAPDAIARLRRFILDLAVRGKLVEQDPEDEPAEEMLACLARHQKSSLLTSNKKSPFPFELPSGWSHSTLRVLVESSGSGWSPKALDTPREGNEWGILKVSAVSWDQFRPEANKQVLPGTQPRPQAVIRKGDFLISRANTAELVARAVIVDSDPVNLMMSDKIVRLELVDLCEPRCILINNNHSTFSRSYYAARATGVSASMKNVTRDVILDLPIPLPPLAEQHRIVAKVDELMALCDQLEAARQEREQDRERLMAATLQRLNQPAEDPASFRQGASSALQVLPSLTTTPAQIKQLRQTILNLAVRGKLVEQDPEDEPADELTTQIALEKGRLEKAGILKSRKRFARNSDSASFFRTPCGWQLSSLGEIAIKITDGAHKTPTYVDKGVPFVSVKDFSAGRLEMAHTRFIPEEEHRLLYQRCDPQRGDILLARIGTLGKAVLVEIDIEFSLFVSVALIRFDHRYIEPRYLCMLLNSPFVEDEFDRIKIGGGTHTNKLNLGDLHSVAIPLPPLAEQHRIVAKVDELMALCDQLEQQLSQADQQRWRMLEAVLAEALVDGQRGSEFELGAANGCMG